MKFQRWKITTARSSGAGLTRDNVARTTPGSDSRSAAMCGFNYSVFLNSRVRSSRYSGLSPTARQRRLRLRRESTFSTEVVQGRGLERCGVALTVPISCFDISTLERNYVAERCDSAPKAAHPLDPGQFRASWSAGSMFQGRIDGVRGWRGYHCKITVNFPVGAQFKGS